MPGKEMVMKRLDLNVYYIIYKNDKYSVLYGFQENILSACVTNALAIEMWKNEKKSFALAF